MASTYTYPESYLAWFIKGNHLAVVTTKGNTAGTSHSLEGQYKPINEAVTNGILIHYYGEPNAVTAITDTPDVDNVFHNSIVDYVKARLYEDKAGNSEDTNLAQVSLNLATIHQSKWKEAVKKNGMKKRDKTGGTRAIRFPSFR
tara:strand:- start:1122 stop:1553 length:432 start_codon:yes stop_codon:yes gene_type:complete